MAKLFEVIVTASVIRSVNVAAETPEEAQGKVTLAEGEAVVEVKESGDIVV